MRINFIFDKTKKSLNFKKKILKFFKNYPAKKADYFVVAGGDGFMLKIIIHFRLNTSSGIEL